MRNVRKLAVLAGLVALTAGIVATTAGADDFVADDDTVAIAPAATADVVITLVAVANDGTPGQDPGCNLAEVSSGRGHFVDVSVTSSDESVATVAPAELNYQACGEMKTITITAVDCGTATVTVHADEWNARGGPNAVFSDEVIQVTVDGPDCNGGPPITVCAQPAAPAWAAAILKANKVKPKQTDNLISQVAQHMEQGATFDGFAKSDQENYANAVWEFLKSKQSGLTKGPAQSARPGWACTNGTA